MNNENKLTEGKITSSLIKFTIPILGAMLLQTMYGSADLIIVGHFSDIPNASGVTTGSQLMMLLTNLCVGLATGATVLVGQKIGAKKNKEIGTIIYNTIILFMGIALAMMVGALIFQNQLVGIMNTPLNAIEETTMYLRICFMGIPMIFAYNILGSIFRGLGDSKTPLIAAIIACIINIVVDIVLVAGFKMGAAGAAIATVLAQAISVVLSIYLVRKKGTLNIWPNKEERIVKISYIKKTIKLGIPIAIQSVITNFSFLAITMIVNQQGVVYSVAVGVSEKITGIIMLIPLAFMQSLSVFVAQNYGAKKHKRSKEGMKVALVISFIFGAIMAYVAFFHGEILAMIFNKEVDVLDATKIYLKAYALDTILVPFLFCFTGYFNGCGQTFFVMVQSILGSLLLRIPLPFIFGTVEPFSLLLVGLSIPIGTIFQIILCIGYYIWNEKRSKKIE